MEHNHEKGRSVLFVFFCRNYKSFSGFRLDKGDYSAFPYEQEYLFMEGLEVTILKVEENFVIVNNDKDLKPEFNGRTLNVIYLF